MGEQEIQSMNIILIAANPDVARRSVNYAEGGQRRRRKRFLGGISGRQIKAG